MKNIKKTFGKGLEGLRTRRGITLRQLRDVSGVPHNSIHAKEKGTGKTDLEDLQRIANGFGLGIHQLLDECGIV